MDTGKWKWFRVDSFCDKPYKAKAYNANELSECEKDSIGALLYITRTDVNNGSKGFVTNENFDKIEKANAITIGDTTSTIYYQDRAFICGDHIVILRSKYFNRYTGLFITTLLNKERYRYNYGRAFTMNNISSTKLKLPITTDGTPDWKYMENFIKESIIPQLPPKAKKVWLKKYETDSLNNSETQFNTNEWHWFTLKELFEIKKGKRLTKEDMTVGNIRYIGAIDSNNGLSALIGNNIHLHKGNTITVSYNGSIGYAFYQDKEFWATDDVNVLYPKFALNQYIALFMCTLIEKEQYRFCYGRKWDLEIMENSRLKLPVTNAGTPDWQFMEDYIKSLPYSKNLT